MIAIYPRVSTQEQAMHGFSMEEQIDRMKKYCEAMGWDAYKVYPDAGFSGATTDRPALQQMIADIKAGKITKVLVYKLDRLSRSQKDTLFLIEDVFLKNNTDFVSMSENFDTSTPFGRAMVGILAVFAQLEREQIKERMAMGKAARAKQGKYYGTGCPIGYDYTDGELVINEFEKLQVQRIFEDYAAGKTPAMIAEELNEAGMIHKSGQWLSSTVRSLLSRKTYIGYIRYRGEWFKGKHTGFIDENLFNTVQEIKARRSEEHGEYKRRVGRATSYLGGYLECGCCHAKYSRTVSKTKSNDGTVYEYDYYKCYSRSKKDKKMVKDPNCKNKTWRMDDLDEAVFAEIMKLKTDPDYYTRIQENRPAEDDKRPVLRAKIDKLKNKISNLLELYADGEMPKDIVQTRIKELNDQKDKLEIELVEFTTKEAEKLSKTETLEIVDSFSEILSDGDYNEIRGVISALIKRIVINGDTLAIHWTFA